MTAYAIRNGQRIPAERLTVPATDAGFMWGTTVAEQIRTFAGQLYRLEQHIQRLFDSLVEVGTEIECSPTELARQAQDLASTNHALLAKDDDLCLVMFVTPGAQPALGEHGPIVGLHTYPIAFADWADKYDDGQRMITSSIRQVAASNWPPYLKCRSRMHYYLADREARQRDPQARALLLDADGLVCEASTANVLAVLDHRLISPRRDKILPGISLAVVEELAEQLEIEFVFRDIGPEELAAASEMMLCSTSCCVLPVSQLDGILFPIGPVYQRLLSHWSTAVGMDIRQQAQDMATKRI